MVLNLSWSSFHIAFAGRLNFQKSHSHSSSRLIWSSGSTRPRLPRPQSIFFVRDLSHWPIECSEERRDERSERSR